MRRPLRMYRETPRNRPLGPRMLRPIAEHGSSGLTTRIVDMSTRRSVPPQRVERDSMGSLEVPEGAYYGASTRRAYENFPISGERFDRRFIWALGAVKNG